MLDVIFAIKFVHVLAGAVVVGAWLCLAVFMLLAHRSGNTSVVALVSRFAVSVEWMVVAGALVLPPLSGWPLAWAIGLSVSGEFWLLASVVLYVIVVAAWLAALRLEIRIRDLTREAALNALPLPAAYRPLFRRWSLLAGPILCGMAGLFALMIWQPRLD